MEIGIDIEENDRFLKMSQKMIERLFTKNEINYAFKHINYEEHLCAFWCVKESFVKALSNRKVIFSKVEINHDKNGKPFIVMNDYIKFLLSRSNFSEIKISLSHSKKYSTATCLLI